MPVVMDRDITVDTAATEAQATMAHALVVPDSSRDLVSAPLQAMRMEIAAGVAEAPAVHFGVVPRGQPAGIHPPRLVALRVDDFQFVNHIQKYN
jgi:hypothetical protein